jgi:hypothetical protein
MRRLAGLVVASLAACTGDDGGVSRAECEAVIAHLVVLERADGLADGPMCKYHSSCDGRARRQFLDMCPRVLTSREARCYQRATTTRSADDCLPRELLDVRIATGERGRGYGGSTFPGVAQRDHGYDDPYRYRDPVAVQVVPDASVPVVGALSALPACERYLAAMDAYLACDQVPSYARDASRESVEYMRKSWADMATMPEDVRRATDDACAQSIDPIRQAAAAMGCTIP